MAGSGTDRCGRLDDLLSALFTASDLRQWIRRGPDGERLAAQLPGESVSLHDLTHQAAVLLLRHGHVDGAFADRLVAAFPRRRAEILGALAGAGPSARLVIPEELAEQYEIKAQTIGEDAVWRAWDRMSARTVALRAIHAAGPAHALQLARELKLLSRLIHPMVERIDKVALHERSVYLVKEFHEGQDLRHWLHATTRSEAEILGVFLGLADALQRAHEHDIVHGTITAANVLIRADGRPVLLNLEDHVLRRAARDDDDSGITIVGTPVYMAPEQQAGAPATTRSDQFSLAALLWHSLHGVHPFPEGIFHRLMGGTDDHKVHIPERSRVAPALQRALLRALLLDPGERFASMRDLARAVEPADPRGGLARLWGGPRRPSDPHAVAARSPRSALWIAVVGVVLAVIALAATAL